MRTVKIAQIASSRAFQAELARVPKDVQHAAQRALALLLQNPHANSLRLHLLTGHGKPTVWKIDILPNRAWQITFEIENSVAHLRRIARHKTIDRRVR